jgi:ABC-type branched-subunit amino acid transport system ATPase component
MLLELRDVRRTFGGLAAVDGASLSVGSGEVHGLIGPNGAGKTTLLNLVSGLIPATSGQILLAGTRLDGLPPHRIAALGVTRTYQNIRLFPALTAADNVLVGAHLRRYAPLWRRMLFLPGAGAEEQAARAASLALLERVGMAGRAGERASNLSYGEQRRVEIARALASSPRVMLLDEPTAGMNPGEVASIAELIRGVARAGHSVLLVEHNVKLVMDVCDRITVLDFGKVIADGTPSEVANDPAVIAAYLGGEAAA